MHRNKSVFQVETLKLFLVGLMLLSPCLSQHSWAQNENDCSGVLTRADQLYEKGDFQTCFNLLEGCINGVAKDRLFESYRLMAICAEQMHQDSLSDAYTNKLLKSNPTYQQFPDFDPMSFTRKLSMYKVTPQLFYGGKVGVSYNSIRLIKSFSITNTNSYYQPSAGYLGGLTFGYSLNDKLSLNLDLLFEGLGYKQITENEFGWEKEFSERANFFSLPITCSYRLTSLKKWNLSADAGLQFSFLNSTQSNISISEIGTEYTVHNSISQKSERSSMMSFGLIGLKADYPLAAGTFVAEVRMAGGMQNFVKPENRYDNINFILENEYVSSDFAFNPLYISFGYQLPIKGSYKVTKIKN